MKLTYLFYISLYFILTSFSFHRTEPHTFGHLSNTTAGDSITQNTASTLNDYVHSLYSHPAFFEKLPSFPVFEKAVRGYLNMKSSGLLSGKSVISIVDFSLSSREKRLWILDLDKKQLLFHTLVSHGKNTGMEYAQNFSNIPSSLQSSIGFYVTGGTYQGKHGLSLYLDGAEAGFNDKARERYIVMHGADYVSEEFVDKHGRLGRSFGCPAVPYGMHNDIIKAIKDKTCLFIYYPDDHYLANSTLLSPTEEVFFSRGE